MREKSRGQRGACIRCILYTAVVMYTSTSPPLPALSDVYVYVLYTYTKICHHACPLYAFYTAEIHQLERFQAGVTVNMTEKTYYGGYMLSRSVSAPRPTIYLQPPLLPLKCVLCFKCTFNSFETAQS